MTAIPDAQAIENPHRHPIGHAFADPLLRAAAPPARELVLRGVRQLVRNETEPHGNTGAPQRSIVDEQTLALVETDRVSGNLSGPLGAHVTEFRQPLRICDVGGVHEYREASRQRQTEFADEEAGDRWHSGFVAL